MIENEIFNAYRKKEKARETFRKEGIILFEWCVDDVKAHWNVTDTKAREILEKTFESDGLIEDVWQHIDIVADALDCKPNLKTQRGLTVEEVKEYYLNTGNPDYEEEPYKSYTDEEWIDYADEMDLER